MLNTLILISGLLLSVCWVSGAYNRLMRLKIAAQKTFKSWQATKLVGSIDVDLQNQDMQYQAKVDLQVGDHLTAVAHYNDAITQFPASIVAVMFGFKHYTLSDEHAK